MSIEIQQTWWHIEEVYFPTALRKIRQVMDIYANDPTMLAGLKNLNFIGLKVITRNGTPKEIGFLEYTNGNYFDILLNLDPLDDFPDAPNTTSFKHVKISVGTL